jgi:7,8-dihydroneopterin aldolase/epimerase/oxygenase
MSGQIKVSGLRVRAHVGVTERERAAPQTVVVDVEVDADLSRAATTDDVSDTVDYGVLVSAVAETVGSSRSKLLENLAAEVISVVSRMDGVRGVTVEIAKDPPPLSLEVERVSVKIEGTES